MVGRAELAVLAGPKLEVGKKLGKLTVINQVLDIFG